MWKKRKLKEKAVAAKKDKKKKKDEFMSGTRGGLSGREMFLFDPKLVSVQVRRLWIRAPLVSSLCRDPIRL